MNPEAFGAVAVICGILTALFWMLVGWRAMRAHEKIAEALSLNSAQQKRSKHESARNEKHSEERSFREFLAAAPLAKHLDPNEQMRRYTEWKQEKSE